MKPPGKTEDTRFTELVEELLEKQKAGKEIVMCEYIDMLNHGEKPVELQ